MVQVNSQTKHYWNTFDKKVKQFNVPSQLPDYFAEMIGDKKEVHIAEVCCGLVNTIGDSWPDTKVEIYCSDKNADSFNSMWIEKKLKPIHVTQEADVEELWYASNAFDIIHCRNALDHTEDPLKAIEELKRVSKEWVYLAHAPNQMDIYGGHHKFNVRLEDGQCIFYGKEYSFAVDGEASFDGELVICKIKV